MTTSDTIRIFATNATWLEGEALRQLERVAGLPGMIRVAAYPDLHPGKGGPVGATMLAEGMFYPYLVGSDVGCGMALFATELATAKAKPEKYSPALRSRGRVTLPPGLGNETWRPTELPHHSALSAGGTILRSCCGSGRWWMKRVSPDMILTKNGCSCWSIPVPEVWVSCCSALMLIFTVMRG